MRNASWTTLVIVCADHASGRVGGPHLAVMSVVR